LLARCDPESRRDDPLVTEDLEVLDDAEAAYLGAVRDDCARCLGPGSTVVDLRRETVAVGVRLVLRYRLDGIDRESAGEGSTAVAAHAALRRTIVIDRLRYGFETLVESR
jgi:hypothetical protein